MAKVGNESQWKGLVDQQTGVVKLAGEIDFTNTPRVRDWLAVTCSKCSAEVLLDLSEVAYIDSSGLAVLIEARKALRARGLGIRVTAASVQVQKLFSLTQIGDLFGI